MISPVLKNTLFLAVTLPCYAISKEEFTGDNSIQLYSLDLIHSSGGYCDSTFAFAFSIKSELDIWLKILQITDR